mgnify:CR=1 FL=1
MYLRQLQLTMVCALAMLIPPAAVATAAYQCTVDGVATFSQLPCGDDAKEIKIPPTNVTQATIAHVAPGIAEALIATAMGLFAAIPAVLAYNRFAAGP